MCVRARMYDGVRARGCGAVSPYRAAMCTRVWLSLCVCVRARVAVWLCVRDSARVCVCIRNTLSGRLAKDGGKGRRLDKATAKIATRQQRR